MTPPTRLQRAVLDSIRRLTVDGVPPSIDELAEDLGCRSRGTIHGLLVRMRERGLIDWTDRSARSLRILDGVGMAITRDHLLTQDDDSLRRIASWARAILVERGAA